MANKVNDLKHWIAKKWLRRWDQKETACFIKQKQSVIPGNPEKQFASHKAYVMGREKRVDDFYNDPIDQLKIIEEKIINSGKRICLSGNDFWNFIRVLDNHLKRSSINTRYMETTGKKIATKLLKEQYPDIKSPQLFEDAELAVREHFLGSLSSKGNPFLDLGVILLLTGLETGRKFILYENTTSENFIISDAGIAHYRKDRIDRFGEIYWIIDPNYCIFLEKAKEEDKNLAKEISEFGFDFFTSKGFLYLNIEKIKISQIEKIREINELSFFTLNEQCFGYKKDLEMALSSRRHRIPHS